MMKIRFDSSIKVLVGVLTLLVMVSVAIWIQLGSLLGIHRAQGSESSQDIMNERGNDGAAEEPRSGISSLDTSMLVSDLEQYPGFRFLDHELDEQEFAAEELARE